MNLTRIAEACEMTIKEASYHRAKYLKAHLLELAERVAYCEDLAEASVGDDRRLWEHFALQVLDLFIAEAKELRRVTRTARGHTAPLGRITEEQIAAARAYPIEKVIGFDSRGKAVAPCHEDRNPSLTWDRKRNRAHCFPCSKDFSALDILVQFRGLPFVEAVKQLAP